MKRVVCFFFSLSIMVLGVCAESGQRNPRVSKDSTEWIEIGYAQQPKELMTGAVSTVRSEQLLQRSVTSLSTALQGVIAGVAAIQYSGQPGDDGSTLFVRGVNSLFEGPLVLVDGVETPIDRIDINTVESVTILKDAAATSIYGARSSNGVILVTTRRGRLGRPTVAYRGYVSLQSPTSIPKGVDASTLQQARAQAQTNLEQSSSSGSWLIAIDNTPNYDTDWHAATMRENALMHSHHVAVDGGSRIIQYLVSGSYSFQDGLLPNDYFQRTNLRANIDLQPLRWLKIALSGNYQDAVGLSPYFEAKELINWGLTFDPRYSEAVNSDGTWGEGRFGINPAALAHDGGTRTMTNSNWVVNGTMTITPLKGWDILCQYSQKRDLDENKGTTTPYGVLLGGIHPSQLSWKEVSRNKDRQNRSNYRLQSSYAHTIKKSFLQAMVGVSVQDVRWKTTLTKADVITENESDYSDQSFYGRIQASYDRKYLLEINGAYDRSTWYNYEEQWVFRPSFSAGWIVSEESFMKPSRSVVDLLKMRASYGLQGNDRYGLTNRLFASKTEVFSDKSYVDPYLRQESMKQLNVGVDASLWKDMLTVTFDYYHKDLQNMHLLLPMPSLGPWDHFGPYNELKSNARLKSHGWEITIGHHHQIGNVRYGVDLNLSDDRNKISQVGGSYLYYDTPNPIWSSAMIADGYPVGGNWGLRTNGFFRNWKEVNASPKINNYAAPGFVKYQKVDQGVGQNPMVIDPDKDRAYLGDPFPHYTFGLRLNAEWKEFDVSLFFQGVGERSTYLYGVGLVPFYAGSNLMTHQLDTWKPGNEKAEYPILLPSHVSSVNYYPSDLWIVNGGFVRLKNVVLGYSLPKNLCQRVKLSSARFYLSGENLLTLSDFHKGYDSEVRYGGFNGGDFYPIMRTFTLGMNLTF